MNREIILLEDACAVTENGRLVEYIPKDEDACAGEWILGKIERLMPGLNCAFVNIGREKAGFLPLKEQSRTFSGGMLRCGDEVLVQIRREEFGEKGAFLTRDAVLPGRYVILMPMNRYIGVSARITDEPERNSLRETGKRLADGKYGMVMRSSCHEASEKEIAEETEELIREWKLLHDRMKSSKCPSVIRSCPDTADQLVADYEPHGIECIRRGEHLNAEMKKQLHQARKRTVLLPGGGNLVIDRCEAMTVIDVNTGSDSGNGRSEDSFYLTNLEACREIAVQVRLRNLSGIILLDLINMEEKEHCENILSTLRKEFSSDRIKTVVHGWTNLGLIEMTRKRTRPDIYAAEMKQCSCCEGTGYQMKDG